MRSNRDAGFATTVLYAGLAGGLAEIVWIEMFSSLTDRSGSEIARQVAATVSPSVAGSGFAAAAGVAVHFVLSLLVAFCFAAAVWPFVKRHGALASTAAAATILAAIWAFNFLVLLPAVNPGFATLLPCAATLTSKVLFGTAMAAALNAREVLP